MYKPKIPVVLIAAMSKDRVIGVDGRLPWHLPEDLQHFKDTTMGRPMIVGRKTFDSIGALPGRLTLVLSRSLRQCDIPGEAQDRTEVYASLEAALQRAENFAFSMGLNSRAEIMVIGGAEVYLQTMEVATHLVLTTVDVDVKGDVTFPAVDERSFYPEQVQVRQSASGLRYQIAQWRRREPAKFKAGWHVRHLKTGTPYLVLYGPEEGARLEATGEPAYVYTEVVPKLARRREIWVRSASEMEDGRFVEVAQGG